MQGADFALNLRLLVGYAGAISVVCKGAAVNRTQFHRYLAGQALPTLRNLRRLCDYFGVEDYEMLMPAAQFRDLIRLRPPRIGRTEDPVGAIRSRIFAGDPPDLIAMGYYHLMFCPNPDSRIFYRALLRVLPAADGVAIKLVERYPRPALSLPGRMVYEGAGFLRHGKLFSVMQEVRHRRSTWFTILSVGDFPHPRILNGTAIGSEPEGNAAIQTYPVVWAYLGAQIDLRAALRGCGYYRRDEIDMLPEVEQMLVCGTTR